MNGRFNRRHTNEKSNVIGRKQITMKATGSGLLTDTNKFRHGEKGKSRRETRYAGSTDV